MTSRDIRPVPFESVVLVEKCQARAKLDSELVNEYAAIYREDQKRMPAVDVFMVDDQPHLVDGFHRLAAAATVGMDFLQIRVVGSGDLDDAVWFATSVNQGHGLRRSTADKRRAIRMALESPIGQEQSSRVIAEHVGVDHKTVSKLRAEWERGQKALGNFPNAPEARPATVKTKDGRSYPKTRKPQPSSAETSNSAQHYAEIAKRIQAVRRSIEADFGEEQGIDRHLEAAWRAADNLVVVDCEQCDGGGCEFCIDGQLTRGAARAARDTLRGRERISARREALAR
jgi:hypothetical protein